MSALLDAKEREIIRLRRQVAWYQRQIFGQKSERRIPEPEGVQGTRMRDASASSIGFCTIQLAGWYSEYSGHSKFLSKFQPHFAHARRRKAVGMRIHNEGLSPSNVSGVAQFGHLIFSKKKCPEYIIAANGTKSQFEM